MRNRDRKLAALSGDISACVAESSCYMGPPAFKSPAFQVEAYGGMRPERQRGNIPPYAGRFPSTTSIIQRQSSTSRLTARPYKGINRGSQLRLNRSVEERCHIPINDNRILGPRRCPAQASRSLWLLSAPALRCRERQFSRRSPAVSPWSPGDDALRQSTTSHRAASRSGRRTRPPRSAARWRRFR